MTLSHKSKKIFRFSRESYYRRLLSLSAGVAFVVEYLADNVVVGSLIPSESEFRGDRGFRPPKNKDPLTLSSKAL
jgi:hypothetical protein